MLRVFFQIFKSCTILQTYTVYNTLQNIGLTLVYLSGE